MIKSPICLFSNYFSGSEAIAFALSSRLAEGNICVSVKEYAEYLGELSEDEFYPPYIVSVEEFQDQLKRSKFVTDKEDELNYFILHNENLYLHRFFTYESRILQKIEALAKENKLLLEKGQVDFQEACNVYPELLSDKSNGQYEAALCGFIHSFSIITGGPGTGKTTTLAKIMILLLTINPDLRIGLAAPTGKASARMNEALGKAVSAQHQIGEQLKEKLTNLQAQTIHKLLGPLPNKITFKYNEQNKLPYDLIVIDESSMIDVALMSKLLESVASGSRIILLGDKDQLASVDAGSIFGDLCKSSNNKLLDGKIITLLKSHRFNPDKGIGLVSKSVLNADLSILENPDTFNDELTIDYNYDSTLLSEYILSYKDYIEEEDISEALNKLNNVRILCAVRDGKQGIHAMNKQIESILSKEYEGDFEPISEFYHNRPIMITLNDYVLNLRNGDVGIIRHVKENGQTFIYAFFDGDENKSVKRIPAALLPQHETVFAMTIHKSQGSEFDKVAVVLPEINPHGLLSRELFYTAITRAKNKVLVQTSNSSLLDCFKKSVRRSSGIIERISEINK